jgi:DNA-binding protein YbaB
MERPQWSALGSLIGDLNKALANATQTRQEIVSVTGVAWSDDRLIKAVVGPRGQLIELEIDARVYRKPDSKQLAASILATVRAATEDATAKTKEIMDRAMPRDRGLGIVGQTAIDRMLASHDADLPNALRGDERG